MPVELVQLGFLTRGLLETVTGGGEGSQPAMTSNSLGESLQNFHDQILATTDLITAALQMVRRAEELSPRKISMERMRQSVGRMQMLLSP